MPRMRISATAVQSEQHGESPDGASSAENVLGVVRWAISSRSPVGGLRLPHREQSLDQAGQAEARPMGESQPARLTWVPRLTWDRSPTHRTTVPPRGGQGRSRRSAARRNRHRLAEATGDSAAAREGLGLPKTATCRVRRWPQPLLTTNDRFEKGAGWTASVRRAPDLRGVRLTNPGGTWKSKHSPDEVPPRDEWTAHGP
jgi:hypothetical protein